MKQCVLIGGLLWIIGCSSALAQQSGTANGIFTAEQAKNGELEYQSKCSSCHGADLHSTDGEAPDLTDATFKFAWQGKTIASRLDAIRTMPQGQPRSLDDQTYLDILAYILQFNGVAAGNQKLVPTTPNLERIVIP